MASPMDSGSVLQKLLSVIGKGDARSNRLLSQYVMDFCVVSCGAVYIAWNWSNGSWNEFLPVSLRRGRQQRRVYAFLERNFTLKTWDWSAGRWWTPVTSAFSHVDWDHLFGNIWSLQSLSAPLIAKCISPARYAGLILGSAVVSGMAYLWQAQHRQRASYQRSMAMRGIYQRTMGLGLSGVVMGVGAAAACAVPSCQVRPKGLAFLSMPLPFYLAGYALFDSYMLDKLASRTAHISHLGGLIFGVVYHFLVLREASPLKRFAR